MLRETQLNVSEQRIAELVPPEWKWEVNLLLV